MAGNKQRRFAKRKKEQARQERAAEKRARKRARSSSAGMQPGDPELENVAVGPQPRDKVSDQEVLDAVERAMNPGKLRERAKASSGVGARLFVGNLDYGTEERELRELFVGAGFKVTDAAIVKDRMTGEPRGFAFVELAGASEAARAIETLHGASFHGRELRVNAADQGGRR